MIVTLRPPPAGRMPRRWGQMPPRRRLSAVIVNAAPQDSKAVQLLVSLATETLRLFERKPSEEEKSLSSAAFPPGTVERPAPGDVQAVLSILRSDYSERAYFVTGVLSDGIYDEHCFFADPTISFRGLELWKRNLRLLVPFLVAPSIDLLGLAEERPALLEEGKGAVLRADWVLKTGLKLPWSPYFEVKGSTEYELDTVESNQVVRHIEAWEIDGWEALRLVLTPASPPQKKNDRQP